VAAGELEFARLQRQVCDRYPEIDERFYRCLSGGEEDTLPAPPDKRLVFLPGAEENPAVAALGPVLAGQQPVCVDERPARVRQMQPLPWLLALFLLLALLCGTLTWGVDYRNRRLEKKLQVVQAENRKLEKRLQPLQQRQQLSKKSAAILQDIEEFISQRPRMYSCLNDIARRVPDGTWFTSLNFRRDSLTLRGESPDALKVVASLRESEFFSQVKLQGTVSKTRNQMERFSLVLQLRKDEKGQNEPVKNK
jgi:Tfp pilus assembly protein PilN